MKKVMCILLVVALAVSMIACDKNKQNSNATTQSETPTEPTTSWLEVFDQIPVVNEPLKFDEMMMIADYKNIIVIPEENKTYTDDELFEIVWPNIVDSTIINKIPQSIEQPIEQKMQALVEEQKKLAQDVYKMDFEAYLIGKGYTKEQFYADIKNYKSTFIKQQMIVYAIAEKESILITQEEMDEAIAAYMKQYNVTQESELANYISEDYTLEIEFELIMKKVKEKILYFVKSNLK